MLSAAMTTPSCAAGVEVLFSARGPAHIAGCVRAVVVIALNRMRRSGLGADVRQECFERLIQDADAPRSVVRIADVLRVVTPRQHGEPRSIFRARPAVRGVPVGLQDGASNLSIPTAARSRVAVTQAACDGDEGSTTVAARCHLSRLYAGDWMQCNDRYAAVCLSDGNEATATFRHVFDFTMFESDN